MAEIEMTMVPFGNAYFNTTSCGRAEYDRDQVLCWRKLCADNGAADCFTQPLLCQHGEDECFGNRIEGCAFLHTNFSEWYPFVNCFEKNGDLSPANAKSCAQSAGLDYSAMGMCANSTQGAQVDVANAKATLKYSGEWLGTPTVTVAGKSVNDPAEGSNLVKAICKALKHRKKVKACKGM